MEDLLEKLFQYIDLKIEAGIENHEHYHHDINGVWLGPSPAQQAEELKDHIKNKFHESQTVEQNKEKTG